MDKVIEFLKQHYQFPVIGVGLLLLIGAIRNWKWVTEASLNEERKHYFIFAMWGKEGYRTFVGIAGFILIVLGIVFLFIPY